MNHRVKILVEELLFQDYHAFSYQTRVNIIKTFLESETIEFKYNMPKFIMTIIKEFEERNIIYPVKIGRYKTTYSLNLGYYPIFKMNKIHNDSKRPTISPVYI